MRGRDPRIKGGASKMRVLTTSTFMDVRRLCVSPLSSGHRGEDQPWRPPVPEREPGSRDPEDGLQTLPPSEHLLSKAPAPAEGRGCGRARPRALGNPPCQHLRCLYRLATVGGVNTARAARMRPDPVSGPCRASEGSPSLAN